MTPSGYLALALVTAVAAAHESRARLARVARLSRLGELTASIAHEVNQPLAAVVTDGDEAPQDGAVGGKRDTALERAGWQTGRQRGGEAAATAAGERLTQA
jgi:signal transduction histidine kinase